jgi:hypothetical protein
LRPAEKGTFSWDRFQKFWQKFTEFGLINAPGFSHFWGAPNLRLLHTAKSIFIAVNVSFCWLKGTQDWDFFWLRFWNLYYFFIIYVKILRFYKQIFLIRPLLGEMRFFRLVWD